MQELDEFIGTKPCLTTWLKLILFTVSEQVLSVKGSQNIPSSQQARQIIRLRLPKTQVAVAVPLQI